MTTGTAYAFFDCSRDIEQVEAVVQDVVTIHAPSTLDDLLLTLKDICDPGCQQLPEPGSEEHFAYAWDQGWPYVIKAESSTRDSPSVAADLADIMNQAYHSDLYAPNEPFLCRIVHRDVDGSYIVSQ